METALELRLSAVPSSVGEARRAIERLLVDRGAPPALVDVVALLVSEVVTNAVLHAGTDVVMAARATADGAHVRVTDFSPVLPSPRNHGEEASTGRGMLLVEAMSQRCGTLVGDNAKTVWFTVGDIDTADPDVAAEVDAAPGVTVRFLGLHVAMARATLAYGEAVLRELTLLDAAAAGDERSWAVPRFSLGPLWEQLDAATAAGGEVVELEVEFPRRETDHCLERLALVEEADGLARDGKLLTVAAVPEVADYRRWIYRQIHGQAHGAAPEPWTPPGAPLPPVVDRVELGAADIDRLGQADTGVVLADDGNRILYANPSAEQLLGWEPGTLVGARLTAIVPPQHRLAHLAGFVRYQVTGESRLLGTTIEVAALRRDGSVVPVALTLSVAHTARGDRVFRAALVAADGDDHTTS